MAEPEVREAKPDTTAFDAFWAALTESKQTAFEEEAVTSAPSFLQKQYFDGKEARGTLWRVSTRPY